MTAFITLNPIDPGTDTRVIVRVCASQDPAHTGAAGQVWWPAIVAQPALQARFFDGDFTSGVDAGSAAAEISLLVLQTSGQFPRVERYDWAGATATIQRMTAAGTLADVAVMRVESFAVDAMRLSLRMASSQDLLETDVLSATYAGTTGIEGGADIKGRVKPWVFGRAANVEPVFIDQIDNVFQVSGYGPISAVTAVYENGASFGTPAFAGDFASYAALVAANIVEGRWGTCLAQGLIRLGAPPAGVITCDVDGDSTDGFLRRTGAILGSIATRRGLSESIDTASLAALDAAVPRNVNIVITEQISFLELVQRMVAPCNAVPGIDSCGRLIASRVTLGPPAFTLDAQGREMPPVLGMVRQNTSAPYKRIRMGAARSWRVHSLSEVAFYADLIDRGLYDAETVYREGDIVAGVDKSRWLYINLTPGSGNAPPTWPTTSNAHWDNLEPPASEDPAIRNASITINGDGEIEGIGDGAGTPVNNGIVVLTGPIDERPITGSFIGQTYAAEGTGDVFRWDGPVPGWSVISDITSAALRVIVPQFPLIEIREGQAGNVGNRTVLHTAQRGTDNLVGGTYSLPNVSLGTGSATISGATGTVTLSSITQSGSYTVRYTHTDGIPTDAVVNLTFVPLPVVAGSPSDSTGGLSPISGGSFVVVTPRNLEITLPSGVTTATLTAAGVALDLIPELPLGATGVEMRWMRESSPGTWTAVGAVATASPSPEAADSGFTDSLGNPIAFGVQGSVTCNRSDTGLPAGSVQKYRLEARTSSGAVRTVLISGTAIATS